MVDIYNKAVRDNIIDILHKKGLRPDYIEIQSDADWEMALSIKLTDEEYSEFLNDKTVSELVDMEEVILALAALKGFGPNELKHMRDTAIGISENKPEKVLAEAINRFKRDHSVSCLVTISKIIRDLAAQMGISQEMFETQRAKKAADRGAFIKRLFLKSVDRN